MSFFRLWQVCLLVTFLLNCRPAAAKQEAPDTVYTGIYITSIHDIDFKQKEYTVTFWLWMKYKNKEFDFLQNLEVPMAKTVTKSYSTIDSSNNQIYILMKLQCVMKDSWKIDKFPFDRQKLRLSIENSQFDSESLVFAVDKVGRQFDPRYTISGWNIDSFQVYTRIKEYETDFGDKSLLKPHTEYSAFRVSMQLERQAIGLFWKMFLGMYVAFLIAYVCFFIHAENAAERFGLAVGALFAVIGNKYVIDSSLPESTTFTLVDTLHGITLIFIFAVILFSIYSLKLSRSYKTNKANRFDLIIGQVLLLIYLVLNYYFISEAVKNC
jgi:hypothetical protein